jgi:hypothetical protein
MNILLNNSVDDKNHIQNRGMTETIIHNNGNNEHYNELKWQANYDGNYADISLDANNNGQEKHYDILLDNKDLARILNIQRDDIPLEKRLQKDFNMPKQSKTPQIYFINLPKRKKSKNTKKRMKIKNRTPTPFADNEQSIMDVFNEFENRHISSPLSDEELIIPINTSNKKSSSNKKRPSHKTYRVLKVKNLSAKPKTNTSSSKRRHSV